MPRAKKPISIAKPDARRIWLNAQRLDARAPFGSGSESVPAAVEHLGYVQIDTINVIERCHHHILFSRIPDYRREHLHHAQSAEKSVFEYWTHALSYIPTKDLRFFLPAMKASRQKPSAWYGQVTPQELRKVLSLLRKNGPLTIRDIDDDVLVEKHHPWASRKPSKRALQLAFYSGLVTIGERSGMLKTYDLIERHFGWDRRPRPATEKQICEYLLDRALRAQGLVSLDSICHLDAPRKPAIRALIERRVRSRKLVPVAIEGAGRTEHWTRPETLDQATPSPAEELVHVLSPFDPLIIQRKRLKLFFGYDHVFEAYVPEAKRRFGYFALPVLIGDRIAAVIDLKADREAGELLIRKWTWTDDAAPASDKPLIEEELRRFERFQLSN